MAAAIVTSGSPGGDQFRLTAGVPYRIGGMPVTLPSEPGTYTLDVLNLSNTDDTNFGMVLNFGFGGAGDPVKLWASAAQADNADDSIIYNPARDHLSGGGLTRTVIPEPPTLILLGRGGLDALRRLLKYDRLSFSAGLKVVDIKYLTYHPVYFMFSTFAYRWAVAIERFVLRYDTFRHFRHTLFCQLRSPGIDEPRSGV